MHSLFLTLSIIAGCITPAIGIYAIFNSGFKPQRMTRFLIFAISLLFVGTLYAQGDKNGIYIALIQLVSSAVLFFLSLKYGMGGTQKFDFFILFLVVMSLVIWKTTANPTLGLLMSIVTDFTSMLPTFKKTWKLPYTEDWKFYLSDVVAGAFNLLSISVITTQSLAFPLYIFLINLTSVVLILGRRQRLHPSEG